MGPSIQNKAKAEYKPGLIHVRRANAADVVGEIDFRCNTKTNNTRDDLLPLTKLTAGIMKDYYIISPLSATLTQSQSTDRQLSDFKLGT